MKHHHHDIKDFPLHWQEVIILHALGHHLSNDEINLELWEKWQESDDDATFESLDILPWEPFEDYEQSQLFELVNNMIYGLGNLIRAIAAPELLEALEDIVGICQSDLETHFGKKYGGKIRAAIAKAKGITS